MTRAGRSWLAFERTDACSVGGGGVDAAAAGGTVHVQAAEMSPYSFI